MQVYELGDRVRVTVPEASDPDHRYHDTVGRVVAVRLNPGSAATGDPRDDYLYCVAVADDPDAERLFRHGDLEPAPG